MRKFFPLSVLAFFMLFMTNAAKAQIAILKTQGWFESGCVTWTVTSGETYSVFIRPEGGTYTPLDNELVRNYGSYGRADVLGIKAGNYQFKVVSSNGDEAESTVFTAAPHDRNGFAHVGMPGGIGAYKNDGTLKDGAKVLYVHANNAKTISTTVAINSKGGTATATGLQDIIYYYQKGYETTPLAIRIVGTIKAADMDRFDSSAEGLQVKGKALYSEIPITIEGVGDDATISGFGILCRNAKGVEFRNFAIMLCMDDCLSLDTGNSNIWVHNMDFFYGNTGGDADQAKGDGTVDIKGKSMNCTVSYNHFYDAGKCSLGGMKSETTDCWMTYHHNWFDHSDSRHPRIRTAFYHVYNNYFDGNSKYGVGVTSGGSAFVESNYFRNCKYPMLISKQGTDATGDGTFSGEPGGVIKAFGNLIKNPRQIWYYDGQQTNGKWDAVKTDTREASVSAVAYSGGTPYNAAADAAAISAVPSSAINAPESIPSIVRGELGAGRMNHGDFTWTFLNSAQDMNYGVIAELKSALQSYRSTLVGFFTGETTIKNGGATKTVNAGDGKGVDPASNDSFVPSWGSGIGGDDVADIDTDYEEEPYLASADGTDYYWVGEHAEAVNAMIQSETITFADGVSGSSFVPDYTNITYKKDASGNLTTTVQCETEKTGSLQLGKASKAEAEDGGSVTIYCPKGVTTFELYTYRTGTTYYKVQQSFDGKSFTTKANVTKAATGIHEADFSASLRSVNGRPCWIRVLNTSTGGLNVQGIRINQIAGEPTYNPDDDDDPIVEPTDPDTPDNPDNPSGDDDPIIKPIEGTQICSFSVATKSPSSDMVTVSGNYSNSKGTVTYAGTQYGDCLKMESATDITIAPTADCTVTLIFGGTTAAAGKSFNLDGKKLTLDSDGRYSFEAKAGTKYSVKKGDSINLFLIIFEPSETTTIISPSQSKEEKAYSLQGIQVQNMKKGIYIVGGKKMILK